MKTTLFDKQGKEVGKVDLKDTVFKHAINKPLLWEAVQVFLTNKRKGFASTKAKYEVKGGGKKPYRQKGIGWARHGTIRSPIWRGGGVVFGPKPRDYTSQLPKKKKFNALLSSLSAKAQEDKIRIITDLNLESPKTKDFAKILKNIKLTKNKTLIGTDKFDENLKLASRNIPSVFVKKITDINCLDVLAADFLLITEPALKELEKRCVAKK